MQITYRNDRPFYTEKLKYLVNVISASKMCSWNNFPINQSDLRDTFTGNGHTKRVSCFCTLDIQLSFPSDFWDKLLVGIGLALGICFWAVNVVPGTNIKSDIELQMKFSCRKNEIAFPVKRTPVIVFFIEVRGNVWLQSFLYC